jgi:hypothetical protein
VCGLAPAGSQMRVTTPIVVDEVLALLAVELPPVLATPAVPLAPPKPPPPTRPLPPEGLL